MKTLILDHDYDLHLGGTKKPGVQKTLECRGDLLYLRGACHLDEDPTFYGYDAFWPSAAISISRRPATRLGGNHAQQRND